MTTATSQQTQISRLFQAMFNAAPGAVHMEFLVNYLSTHNATMTDMANALAATSVFTAPLSYPSTLTNTEFAEHFVTKIAGGTVSAATHSAVVSAIATLLNNGQSRGEVMLLVSDRLASATNIPEWAVAAAQFNNRVEVANYYSVDRAGGAMDFGTLQAVTANVTDSAASVTAGKAVFDTAVIGEDSDISGATIFVDFNGNDFRDLGDPNTTSDIHGQFTLPDGSFGRLVASGGHDMTTNLPFAASFTAPAGSTVINPLTTLVQALVDQGTDIALAKAWVSSSLGLSASIDLTRFAALDEITGVNSDAAIEILAASVQANNLFTVTAKALTSVDDTLDMRTAFAQVVEALAEKITSATSVLDLTNAAFLKEVIIAAAGDDPALIASMVDLNNDLSLLISDNNTTIAEISLSGNAPETMRSQILQVARITQGRESAALAIDIESGNGLAAVLTAYTDTAFDTLVSTAIIGDVDGDGTIDAAISLDTLPPPPAGDTTAPTLSSSTPADNATGRLVGSNLVLNFNEAIQFGSGNIVLKKTSDNSAVETFNVATGFGSGGGIVSYSGTGVTINPFANLAASTEYYLTVASTAVTDAAGNAYAGISSTTALSFTTNADATIPTLSSSTPADNATAVAVGSNIVLTFSENVAAGTGNILIRKVSDGSTVATIAVGDAQVAFNGTTGVTINPTADLISGTAYYVTMASGVITDTAGNPYAGIVGASVLNFTTLDTTPPTLSSSTPADNATGTLVGSNLVLTFNEAIALGTGNIVLKKTSDGSVIETFDVATGDGDAGGTVTASGTGVTINPGANLSASTEYYLTVAATAVEDISGNAYAGISSTTALSFTTNADAIMPILSSSTPADNATAVAVDGNIVLTFSENVAAGTGNILIRRVSDNFAVATIPVGDAQVTFNGTTGVTINPTADLATGVEYYVTMASGVITDTVGNPYAGISLNTVLTFTTQSLTLTTANDTLTGSAGDDTFTGTYGNGAGPYTLNVGDILNGGDGSDTLYITTGAEASTPPDGLLTNTTNFEKIEFVSTGNGAQVVTTGAEFLQAFATGADVTVETLLGAITVTMTGYTQAATINTTTTGEGAHEITTGSGAAIVNATAIAAGAQTIKGIGLTTVNATIGGAGDQVIGDALGNGVNLVTVNATVSAAGAQTITSTSTSAVTVIANAFAGAQTIVTGSGNDSITLTTATGQVTSITTNAGNDTIVASLGTDLITGGLGADTMTGGGAVDTFAFGTNGSVLGTSMDIITDFNTVGADILTFGTATALVGVEADGTIATSDVDTTAGGLITFAAADDTLAKKIVAVQADTQLDAAGLVAMFVDGANTYLYYSGAAIGNADDQLIQLSGITTLVTITGGGTTVIA